MPLPRYLSLRHVMLGAPYSNWTKRHFQNHIRTLPNHDENKVIMTAMLARMK